MKKALILLLLLPFAAFSQSTLVRWRGFNGSNTATTYDGNVTAGIIAGSGINFTVDTWNGFQSSGWPASSAIDANKYIQFTAAPTSGYNITLSSLNFQHLSSNGTDGANNVTIKYSLSSDFSNPVTILDGGAIPTSATDKSVSFSNAVVPNGKTLYVRIYGYNRGNQYWDGGIYRFNHVDGNGSVGSGSYAEGISITGTVATAAGIIAFNDTASTVAGFPVTIDAAANDIATGTTISNVAVVTSPANGTATVSNGKIIFTPATGWSGTNSFTYKAIGVSGTQSNTATITVTVAAQVNPVATADSVTTVKNAAATTTILSNDTAGNGSITAVTVSAAPAHGTTTVNSDKSITYTPATGYTGIDSYQYTITNTYGFTATATVSVVVNQPAVGTSPLNGTYVISAATQYAYQQFATLTAAVAALNNNGISGAVTFLLKDVLYSNTTETFPLTVNAITNSSSTNVVTFRPYPGITTAIEATDINDYTGVPAVFILKGADYIVFDGSNTVGGTSRNLTVTNKDNLQEDDRTVFYVASSGSGATNITIKNTVIKQSEKNSNSRFNVGVYSGEYGLNSGAYNGMNVSAASYNNSYLTVTNNDFTNVKQGVYINGGTGANITTNVLVNKNDLGANTIAETIICPATFSNVDTFEYSENLINNLYRATTAGSLVSAGIYITGASKNGNILRNNMRDLTKTDTNNLTFGGIVLSSTVTNSNILVANNFILNVAAQGNGGGYLNGYGIIVDNGGGYKIYHNTVNLTTNQPNGGFSAALYVNSSATGLDVRNNIFANNQNSTSTRRTAITVNSNVSNINTIFTTLDYNDYSSLDRIGYIGNVTGNNIDWPGNGVPGDYGDNADYTYTIGAWKNVTGKDTHSINVVPAFAAASDFHIDPYAATSANLDNLGTPIAAVTKDIEGQLRSTTTPDMGADEFGGTTMPTAGDNSGIYCTSATTWDGAAWSNGLPDSTKDVIFSGAFTQTGSTFYACSLYVLNGAVVSFTGNASVIVTHSVNIAATGSLTFDSGSVLTQVENDANSGTATVKRNSGNLKRLDYTMWTSPVYDARATGFWSLLNFSPATSTNRFYTYSNSQNIYNAVSDPATVKFARGKGYLIRMPNADATSGYNAGTARLTFNGVFQGTPNNGIVKVALDYVDAAHGYNAVGNPYPSPINITDFINNNINNIEGTIWLWRKNNDSSMPSYSTCNLSGYVANVAPGGTGVSGNEMIVDPYSLSSKGILNTGQGFIVQAKAANKELVFNNNLRVQSHSTAFFRSATTDDSSDEAAPVQPDRVWLNLSNTAGAFSQSLIAYSPMTTLAYDNGYDGQAFFGGPVNVYSVIQSENDTLNLAIQSRGNFVTSDVVKMAYKAQDAGTLVFSLDHFDGLFANDQKVILVDNVTGLSKDLKEGSYTFDTEAGTFDSRFTIVYATQAELGTTTPAVDVKQMVVYKSGNQIKIQAPQDIKSVMVYDMLGKVVYQTNNVDGTEFATTDIATAQQVVIVQVALDNGQVVSKKIIMN